MKKIIFILISIYSYSSLAYAEHCSDKTFKHVQIPLYYNKQNTHFFNYSFRYIKGANPLATTIIYIRGKASTQLRNSIQGYNTIRLDPRSVGCNKGIFPEETLTTNTLAKDIIKVIKYLDLDDYILYGVGYGTQLTTVLTSLIQKDLKVRVPKSIILEGVLGRSFKKREVFNNYFKEWNKVKQALPLLIKNRMEKISKPLGFNKYEMGNFISTILSLGKASKVLGFKDIQWYLKALYGNSLLKDKVKAKALIQILLEGTTVNQEESNLFKVITCSEISTSIIGVENDYLFESGELKLQNRPSLCTNLQLLNAYDSKQFQIEVPIFYIQGANDPSIPLWQAKYHYSSQVSNDQKFFGVFAGVAHGALQFFKKCQKQMFQVFINEKKYNDFDFFKAIKHCVKLKN